MEFRPLGVLAIAAIALLGSSGECRGSSVEETSNQILLHFRPPAEAPPQGTAAGAAPQEASAARVEVVEQRQVAGAPQRQRNPELSTQHLVVVVLTAENEEITRVLIRDPRLVRAEVPDLSGDLKSELRFTSDVQFPVVIPDDPNARRLEIYHPVWSGTEFILEFVGATQLP